jgi:hypothetical protein
VAQPLTDDRVTIKLHDEYFVTAPIYLLARMQTDLIVLLNFSSLLYPQNLNRALTGAVLFFVGQGKEKSLPRIG